MASCVLVATLRHTEEVWTNRLCHPPRAGLVSPAKYGYAARRPHRSDSEEDGNVS